MQKVFLKKQKLKLTFNCKKKVIIHLDVNKDIRLILNTLFVTDTLLSTVPRTFCCLDPL